MHSQLRLFDPEVLRRKLADANTPGFRAEFDPDEAEHLGAFVEDALDEDEALEATCDVLDLVTLFTGAVELVR